MQGQENDPNDVEQYLKTFQLRQVRPLEISSEQNRRATASWWEKGLTTMRIPKLAFGVMLIAIIALSSGLVMVRARAGAASGRFLELKYRIGPSGLAHSGRVDICVMRVDGSQKGNTCDFVDHGRDGLLLVNTRLTGKVDESAQLRIRAKYIPGDGDTEVDYSEALFKDIPEKVLPLEPSAKQEFEVAGLGKIEVEGEYLDVSPVRVSPAGDA